MRKQNIYSMRKYMLLFLLLFT